MSDRHRCCIVGCNPKLDNRSQADEHRLRTGHRIAKWPVRSESGEREARRRNRTGYYDKYNVGDKSYAVRFGLHQDDESPEWDGHKGSF